jgi:hypothetical protein
MSQLILDSPILETLLELAVSAFSLDDESTEPHAQLHRPAPRRQRQRVAEALTMTGAEPLLADERPAHGARAMSRPGARSTVRWAGAVLITLVLLGVFVLVVAGGAW